MPSRIIPIPRTEDFREIEDWRRKLAAADALDEAHIADGNIHVDHTEIDIIAGYGLDGGGTIDADVTLIVNESELNHSLLDMLEWSNAGHTIDTDIVMNDNSMTGTDNITFTDVNGEIAGIENQNLLDKTASESLSGLYTWTANGIKFNDDIPTVFGTDDDVLLDYDSATDSFQVNTIGNTDIVFLPGGTGMVGVGIDTPTVPFHVYRASAASVRIESANASTTSFTLFNTAGSFQARLGGTGNFTFRDAANAKNCFSIIANTPSNSLYLDVTEAVINQNGGDYDFRVEASGLSNALFVRGSDGSVDVNGLFTSAAGRVVNTKRIDSGDSPYTVLATDHIIICDTDGGAIEVDLTAGVAGKEYRITNVGTSGNDVTVDPNGTEEIFNGGAGVAFDLHDSEGITINYDTTEGWW